MNHESVYTSFNLLQLLQEQERLKRELSAETLVLGQVVSMFAQSFCLEASDAEGSEGLEEDDTQLQEVRHMFNGFGLQMAGLARVLGVRTYPPPRATTKDGAANGQFRSCRGAGIYRIMIT